MKKISEKKLIAIILGVMILLVGVVGWLIMSGKKPAVNYAYASVKKGTLTDVVKTTGEIKAAQELNLSFERSGNVKNVAVKVGDGVKAGQVLIELDNTDVSADASQASAAVSMAQSQLLQLQAALNLQKIKKTEMLKGARPEEIQLVQTKRDSANQSLQDAQTNLNNVTNKAAADRSALVKSLNDSLQGASAVATDVVNRQTNDMFVVDGTQNTDPKLVLNTALDSSAKGKVESQRINAAKAVDALKSLPGQLSPDYSNYDQTAGQAIDQLSVIRDYLNSLNSALGVSVITVDIPQTSINTFKGSVSTSLSGINGSITGMNSYRTSLVSLDAANENAIKSAQSKVDDAKNALTLADNQLTLEKAGATEEELSAQDALISQAQAAVDMQRGQIVSAQANADKMNNQVEKTIIKSPVDGTVTKLDLDAGEAITAGSFAAGVISNAKFQIEGYVPETDIAGIKIGSTAEVTLDSVGDGKPYGAKVVLIDPAATITNGTPAYKVKLEFDQEDTAIKSGLTANLRIMTDEEKDVLIIPETALIKEGEDRFVIVKNGTSDGEKRKVSLGKVVQDGSVGVLSGLSEGDQVADFAGKPIK
jgi:HlyD family secretion protein